MSFIETILTDARYSFRALMVLRGGMRHRALTGGGYRSENGGYSSVVSSHM